jgi:hypothetical protein
LCRYCYANASADLVARNLDQIATDGESILLDGTVGKTERRQGAGEKG